MRERESVQPSNHQAVRLQQGRRLVSAVSPDDWLRCLDADVATCRTACLAVALSLPLSLSLSLSLALTAVAHYIFRLRSDTCSDPRKCDFEPGISWRRLKNKTLLLPPLLLSPLLPLPLPLPVLLLQLQLHLQQLLLLALAAGPVDGVWQLGVGWIICYDDYADAATAASRPWGGCWRWAGTNHNNAAASERPTNQPNHPPTPTIYPQLPFTHPSARAATTTAVI